VLAQHDIRAVGVGQPGRHLEEHAQGYRAAGAPRGSTGRRSARSTGRRSSRARTSRTIEPGYEEGSRQG
jgi:hypothetical protein